jgi:predicted GIY-YIG superfamily endonuclease
MKSNVYVLKLGSDRYYVGRVDEGFDMEQRLKRHTDGSACSSKWVARFGFQSCVEIIQGDEFTEMVTTLRYMNLYGIDNVRGGPWSYEHEYHNNFIAKQAERIIQSVYNKCHLCGRAGHYSSFCPGN